jgi:hypothetical protein
MARIGVGASRGDPQRWANLRVGPPKGSQARLSSGGEPVEGRASVPARTAGSPAGAMADRGGRGPIGKPRGRSSRRGPERRTGKAGPVGGWASLGKRASDGGRQPGVARPGFRETKPFGAASFGAGAATGWRADRRSETWLLSGAALPTRRAAPPPARRRPGVARILFAGNPRDAGPRLCGPEERVIARPAGPSRGLPKMDEDVAPSDALVRVRG